MMNGRCRVTSTGGGGGGGDGVGGGRGVKLGLVDGNAKEINASPQIQSVSLAKCCPEALSSDATSGVEVAVAVGHRSGWTGLSELGELGSNRFQLPNKEPYPQYE